MVLLSTNAAATLAANETITFNVVRQTGNSEYVPGSSANQVFLRANGLYLVDFTATVTSTAAATPVQLQLTVNGSPLPETLRAYTATAAGDLGTLAMSTAISTSAKCCFNLGTVSVTVTNTGANAIVINPGAALRIGRVG